MKPGTPGSFGVQLKALREAAGFTQEELATIAGLSVHAVSALERGERRRPHVETVRALSAALDLTGATRDALLGSVRASTGSTAADELSRASLPLPETLLLGRDADVRTLGHWLADPPRLITLIGPGGVGKTRLALELARAIAEEGSTRVVFVSLASIRDAAFVASAIAEALGLAVVSAVDLPRRARADCDGHPTLLMLDNFEQVLAAAPLVADLLASVAALRLLVTSRAALRVRGERELHAVGPLKLEADAEAMPPADYRAREDLESYRGALAWLIERGRPAEASDLAYGLMFFWMIRGHAAEGLRWYEQILNLPRLPPAAESRARLGAAAMVVHARRTRDARTELTRVLQLAQDVGDRNILAQAEMFRDLESPSGAGDALSGLAEVALATGDVSQAELLLDEAALTLRKAGPWFPLLALYVRAILAVRRGDPDEAIAFVRENLTRVRTLHDKFAFVYVLVPLAAAAALKGADAWTARILGAQNAVTERTGATVVDNPVDDLREQAERDARARLSSDRWARAYAAGRAASIDSLMKDIDGL